MRVNGSVTPATDRQPGVQRKEQEKGSLFGFLTLVALGYFWRKVAVKELRPPAGVSPEEQDVFRRRALSEARSAARLTHPNAVTLYDVIPASPADDAVYLIMEYVAGASLAQLVAEQGPLSEPRAAEIALQLLSVLDAAHALASCTATSSRPTS